MKSSNLKQVHVIGGEFKISADPATVFITVLGSCVSACIYDPVQAIGGMNHFILPIGANQVSLECRNRYGEVAMRSLVDGLLRRGAKRERLIAKLYGGRTNNPRGLGPGVINAAFARDFLQAEGIRLMEAKLGEDLARWVTFSPVTGETKVREAADPNAVRMVLPSADTKTVHRKIAC